MRVAAAAAAATEVARQSASTDRLRRSGMTCKNTPMPPWVKTGQQRAMPCVQPAPPRLPTLLAAPPALPPAGSQHVAAGLADRPFLHLCHCRSVRCPP